MLLWIPVALISIFLLFLLHAKSLTLLRLFVNVEIVKSKTLFEQLCRGFDTFALLFIKLFLLSYGCRIFKHAEPLPMMLFIAIFQSLVKRFKHHLAHFILLALMTTLIYTGLRSPERLLLLLHYLESLRLMEISQRCQQTHVSDLSLSVHFGPGLISSLFIIVCSALFFGG